MDELSTTQSEPAEVSERTPMPFSLKQGIPESTTEITTEKKTIPYADIIQYLNEKIGKSFKSDSWKTNQGILPYLTSLLLTRNPSYPFLKIIHGENCTYFNVFPSLKLKVTPVLTYAV
nr:hypothetical protein [Neobacillus sp. 179.-C4.2 HS]MDP5194663.1 hypothetical protein [Neobacillus sp. 179.-C4.2 HS]